MQETVLFGTIRQMEFFRNYVHFFLKSEKLDMV